MIFKKYLLLYSYIQRENCSLGMSYMRPDNVSLRMKLCKFISMHLCCSWFKTKSRSPEPDDIESCMRKVRKENHTGQVKNLINELKTREQKLQTKYNQIFQTLQKKHDQVLKEKKKDEAELQALKVELERVTKEKCTGQVKKKKKNRVKKKKKKQMIPIPVLKRREDEPINDFLASIKYQHGLHIIQAKKGKGKDGHKNEFYCCSCPLPHKNHTSFQNKKAVEKHCKLKHGLVVSI